VAVILVLVFVVFKGDDKGGGSPEAAVTGFYNAARDRDVDKAMSYVCAADRGLFSDSDFTDTDTDSLSNLKIVSTTKSGDHWNVKVSYTEDGDSQTDTIRVIKENGDYLVCPDLGSVTSDLSDFSDFSDYSDDFSDYTDYYSDFSDYSGLSDYSDYLSDFNYSDYFSGLSDLFSGFSDLFSGLSFS